MLALAAICGRALPAAQAACTAERRAELPLTPLRNFLLVPASLDGGTAILVVDTGAEATTVTPETVANFHLVRTPDRRMLLGVGGAVRSFGMVRLHRLDLGGLQLGDLSLDIGMLPRLRGPGGKVGGLLGLDVLGGYDIALDASRRRMTLYAVPPCPAFVPPGYAAADGIALRQLGRLMLLTVRINGSPVRALLDTGARSSLLATEAAARLGVTDGDLSRDPVTRGRGIGARPVPLRRHRFREVRVGAAAVRDMVVDIGALPVPGVDMLLGADWLSGRRLWISPAAGRLFQR